MSSIKKVLIIDDCPVDSFLNEKALAKFHEEIKTKIINLPLQALAYLKSISDLSIRNQKEIKPDIIFLDLHMPQMTGFQLLDELEKNEVFIQNPIAIYVLSSSGLKGDIQTALKNKLCHGYITKPLTQIKLNKLFS